MSPDKPLILCVAGHNFVYKPQLSPGVSSEEDTPKDIHSITSNDGTSNVFDNGISSLVSSIRAASLMLSVEKYFEKKEKVDVWSRTADVSLSTYSPPQFPPLEGDQHVGSQGSLSDHTTVSIDLSEDVTTVSLDLSKDDVAVCSQSTASPASPASPVSPASPASECNIIEITREMLIGLSPRLLQIINNLERREKEDVDRTPCLEILGDHSKKKVSKKHRDDTADHSLFELMIKEDHIEEKEADINVDDPTDQSLSELDQSKLFSQQEGSWREEGDEIQLELMLDQSQTMPDLIDGEWLNKDREWPNLDEVQPYLKELADEHSTNILPVSIAVADHSFPLFITEDETDAVVNTLNGLLDKITDEILAEAIVVVPMYLQNEVENNNDDCDEDGNDDELGPVPIEQTDEISFVGLVGQDGVPVIKPAESHSLELLVDTLSSLSSEDLYVQQESVNSVFNEIYNNDDDLIALYKYNYGALSVSPSQILTNSSDSSAEVSSLSQNCDKNQDKIIKKRFKKKSRCEKFTLTHNITQTISVGIVK